MKSKTKEAKICEECHEQAAGVSEFNETGILSCQRCGEALCEECAEYIYSDFPYCPECRDEQKYICDKECRGKGNCRGCDYC